jgi:signal transduction histidine kinase
MGAEDCGQTESLQAQVAQLERQLQGARRIASGLSSVTKFEQLVEEALTISLDVVGAGAGSILLYDPKKQKLVFRYVIGEKAADLIGLELNPAQGIAGKVFQSGESDICDDVSTRKEHLREVGERIGYATRDTVTVALRSIDSKPIGVMQVLNKAHGEWAEPDVALLEIMASQIAAALETARLNDEARLALVVRFIGNISHDVKNLMTPIQTAAQTLAYVSDECMGEVGETLELIQPLAARERLGKALGEVRELYPEMIGMIMEGCDAVQQRMSEISAAVKGVVSKPYFELTDIVSLAHRVGGLLAAQAKKQGMEIVVEIHESMPEVVCDKKQVYNLIYNLIFNAMDEGVGASRVVVRVRTAPRGVSFPEGDCFLLECEDNGGGMPPEVKARLFTDDAVSTKPMGTGLGTRIIKNVVDAHKGKIELWSEIGEGTRITCRVPLGLAPSAGPPQPE